MLTTYGKILRKIRIDEGELLSNMANNLEISSAYLSSIENGDREIPEYLSNRIGEIYNLSDKELDELRSAETAQLKAVKVDLEKTADFSRRQTAMVFARTFNDIDDETMQRIRSILMKGED